MAPHIPLKFKLCYILLLATVLPVTAQYRASEWDEREKWQNTAQILEYLDLTLSMFVADIGCHEGYLTMKLSPLVGPNGLVYAVDIDKHRLSKLDKRLDQESINNVRTILGEPNNPKLPVGQLDRVIMLDTYHEIKEHQVVLDHIYQALKPGGKLVLVEPIAEDRRSWTRKQQAEKHEISLRYALKDLELAGFRIDNKEDPFINRPSKNDQMWIMVASRPIGN